MTRTTLAVAADYADAMLVARRWKNLLFLVLLLCVLIQIGVFVFQRTYSRGTVTLNAGGSVTNTTQPSLNRTQDLTVGFAWLVNISGFVAMVCVVVLAIVLLLIVLIMLVGRLIGVAHVTGAFVWCVVLAALLFPWQSLWNYPQAGVAQNPAPEEQLEVGPHFGLPGALYTWPELEHRAHFANTPPSEAILGWARFVAWPVVAILLLFTIQVRSSRGLRFALGEAEVQVVDTGIATTPPGAV